MDMSLDWKRQSLSRRIDILNETSGLSPHRVRNGHNKTSFTHFKSLYGYNTPYNVGQTMKSGNRNKEQRILQRLDDWIQLYYQRDIGKSNVGKISSEVPLNSQDFHRKGDDAKASKLIIKQGLANIHIGMPRFRRKSSSSSTSPTRGLNMCNDEEMVNHVVENYDTRGVPDDDQNVLDMIQSAKTRSQNMAKASPRGGAAERKLRQRNKKNFDRRVVDSDSLSVCSASSIDGESLKKAEELAFTANKYGTLPRTKINFGFLKAAFEDKSNSSVAVESAVNTKDNGSVSKATGTTRRKSFLKFNKRNKKEGGESKEQNYVPTTSTSLPSTPNPSRLYWTEKAIYTDGQNTPPTQVREVTGASTLSGGNKGGRFRSSHRRRLFSLPGFYNHKKESREMENI